MLYSVPAAINRAARQVTLRHPNAFDCTVSRKVVKRVEPDEFGDPSEMGGSPTLGGMGVLRSEDEVDFDYLPLGPGKVVFAGPGPFQQQDMNEHDSATLVERSREVLMECVAKPDAAVFFVADTGDLVMLVIGPGVVMSYEVASVGSAVALPPFERRYVLTPRDDLSYVAPFTR